MLAALSVIIIGLIGLPVTRWFLGASLVVGVFIALLRRWIGRIRVQRRFLGSAQGGTSRLGLSVHHDIKTLEPRR